MNYQKHYDALISRAQTRTLSEYSERHHIVPKCMGGSNKKENLVRLTPEEHYVAHQLLVKIYPGNCGLIYATNMMTVKRPTNKTYGWLRRKFITASKTRIGSKNWMYKKCWITNYEISRVIDLVDGIPDGWVRGRFPKPVAPTMTTERRKLASVSMRKNQKLRWLGYEAKSSVTKLSKSEAAKLRWTSENYRNNRSKQYTKVTQG